MAPTDLSAHPGRTRRAHAPSSPARSPEALRRLLPDLAPSGGTHEGAVDDLAGTAVLSGSVDQRLERELTSAAAELLARRPAPSVDATTATHLTATGTAFLLCLADVAETQDRPLRVHLPGWLVRGQPFTRPSSERAGSGAGG